MPNSRRSQSAGKRESAHHRAPESSGVSAVNSENPEVTRQQLEAELAIYRSALDRAREEFKAFAYSVSHDLRAPLRAIEGFSRILLEDFSRELSEEPRRFLDHIITNSQQLTAQIDDLLKFYRAVKSNPTKIPVNADLICKEALAELNGELSKVVIEQEKLPSVMADPVQLREIFTQLLSNAVKYSAKKEHPKVQIGARVEPGAITFYVRDNGVGFDSAKTEHLFEVFQKMHNTSEFPGNGIGLAIVRRLVEAHGGCVMADAQPGDGAVFCFSLPNGGERLTYTPKCAVMVSS